MTEITPDRVVVISDFSRVQGGASKIAVLQAENLNDRGVPVTFFSGDKGGAFSGGISNVAINGARLLETHKLSAALHGLWNQRAQIALATWIAEHDTSQTIYHVHGYHQILSPSVLKALVAVKRRVVVHAHDYFLACPNGAFFDYRSANTCRRRPMSCACITRNCDKRNYAQKLWRVSRQTIQNRVRKDLCPELTTLLIHSGMENYLYPDGADGHVRLLPNPVDRLFVSPIEANMNKDIVYVGDIHKYKGVELLASAARKAGVKIRFVGTGQDLNMLAETYPEHQFDGWQDREGLQKILSGARLLVSPTLGPEPFGLAPVEALRSGIPVLMSDSMLLASQITENGMGVDFAAGNIASLSARLVSLASNDSLIARFSANARKKSGSLALSTDEWADALLLIYAEILIRNGNG